MDAHERRHVDLKVHATPPHVGDLLVAMSAQHLDTPLRHTRGELQGAAVGVERPDGRPTEVDIAAAEVGEEARLVGEECLRSPHIAPAVKAGTVVGVVARQPLVIVSQELRVEHVLVGGDDEPLRPRLGLREGLERPPARVARDGHARDHGGVREGPKAQPFVREGDGPGLQLRRRVLHAGTPNLAREGAQEGGEVRRPFKGLEGMSQLVLSRVGGLEA